MPDATTPRELLKAKTKPDIVEVPERLVLAISGASPPDAPDFAEAVGALYGVAYTLRFARKKEGREPFKVGTLEGEWWAEGADLPVDRVPDRSSWRWRLRSAVPDDMTDAEVAAGIDAAVTKKGGKLEGSERARQVGLATLPAERVVRMLHVGPYADEPESFAAIDAFLAEQGLARVRRHVEVYLSDPSRTAPEKLKTVLLARVAPSG